MSVAVYFTLFQLIFEADQLFKGQDDHHILFLLNFLYQELYDITNQTKTWDY